MNAGARAALDGAHVVVIGGSSGIGLAAAAAIKAQGGHLTLVGRSASKLEAAAQQLGGARTVVADIASRTSIEASFASMTRIDHLVITAGSLHTGKLVDTDPDPLLVDLHERLAGPLYSIKAALPWLHARSSIVLTGGQYADRPPSSGAAIVAAAVSGVEALARALALELKPIRVNVVAPGLVDTPLFDVFGQETRSAIFKQAADSLPVGRAGRPEEIAEAISFLMSNGYVTGEVLHVDGGGRLV
ncbi:SDR family oxidoreductase [Trinickia fusca]|uniref:SDR family oxidoreductase n=1 Tax=Trinickia fusca TaxID=2419777 RepID=A0A494XTH3_9BURK|nr:SDR family oxidoreductase [Trinickia fusca]RKP52216.1 SDR family oxidoreductase [Trinickia fusca]